MLAEVVVVVSTAAAVVAVALMPFFTRLLAQLLSVLASRCNDGLPSFVPCPVPC